jgi:hypothetical protein
MQRVLRTPYDQVVLVNLSMWRKKARFWCMIVFQVYKMVNSGSVFPDATLTIQ